MMLTLGVLSACLVLGSGASANGAKIGAAGLDPVADPAAVVITGNGSVRITVLTDRLLRIERRGPGSNSTFVDAPTLAFVNRKLTVPKFSVERPTSDSLVLTTAFLKLEYKETPAQRRGDMCAESSQQDADCGDCECHVYRTPSARDGLPNRTTAECCAACNADPDCNVWVSTARSPEQQGTCYLLTDAHGFKPASDRVAGGFPRAGNECAPKSASGMDGLRITLLKFGQGATTWTPASVPTGNLLGTTTSLDGITGGVDIRCYEPDAAEGCTLAPISRDGWAVYDDAATPTVDPTTDWYAAAGTDTADLYFFGHGHDYPAAMRDFTQVAGPVPSVPRFALGYWWSRYWPYTAEDLLEIAQGYAERSIPIDVVVSDMAWHYHAEQKVDWGGYAWSPELFPAPQIFVDKLSTLGLNMTLNLHLNPAQHGVDPGYGQLATRLGFDPAKLDYPPIPGKGCPHPYDGSQNVASLLKSSKAFGEAYLELLNTVPGVKWWWLDDVPEWTARILYENTQKTMNPSMAFSRWGGLGSHRYPIGFSGDTYMEWVSLQFQPSFTAAAANVLFWWSHDIGGHRSHHNAAAYDPELYLRWLQWGAHAPIMRTHPQPDPDVERRPWGHPLPYSDYMEGAIRRRGQLVPAIHTGLEQMRITSLSPLRSLYIDWPELDGAYAYNDTYLFVNAMVVAPMTTPQDNTTQLATRRLWLPPGEWIDTALHRVINAPANGLNLTVTATLWETPVFVPAGAVIPVAPPVTSETAYGAAARSATPSIHGDLEQHWELWTGGATAGSGIVFEDATADWINCSFATASANSLTISVTQPESASLSRVHQFDVKMAMAAMVIKPCDGNTQVVSSTYSGALLQQTVRVSSGGSGAACVELSGSPLLPPEARSGYVGLRERGHVLKQTVDHALPTPNIPSTGLYNLTTSAIRIELALTSGNPKAAIAELSGFPAQALAAVALLEPAVPQNISAFARAWLQPPE